MRLPDTNAITLPDSNSDWICISNSDPPVPTWDTAKMLELLPARAREAGLDVRDAVLRAVGRKINLAWACAERLMAAQRTPRAASGRLLVAWGRARHLPPSPGESEPDHRARLLEDPVGITIPSIREALDALLRDPVTGKRPVIVEPKVDFISWSDTRSNGTTGPRCYWQSREPAVRRWGAGRRLSERTGGVHWTSMDAPPAIWVLVPATLSKKRGGWATSSGTTRGAFFYGTGSAKTVWGSAKTAQVIDRAIRTLATRAIAGVQCRIVVDPALSNSVTR